MTKKDFELIAYCIFTANITDALSITTLDNTFLEKRERATRRKIAEWFADNLERTNPRFDRNRFLSACGIE